MTTDDKHSLRNRGNLPQLIQMQLSKKQKTFSQFFVPFLKFSSDFKDSEKKKDDRITYVFPKLETAKQVVSYFSKKPRFRKPFDSKHAKAS